MNNTEKGTICKIYVFLSRYRRWGIFDVQILLKWDFGKWITIVVINRMLTVLFLRILFFFFTFFFFLIVSARIVRDVVPTLWTSCVHYKILFGHAFETKYVFRLLWKYVLFYSVAARWHWLLKPMKIATKVRDCFTNITFHSLVKMLFPSLHIRSESYILKDYY